MGKDFTVTINHPQRRIEWLEMFGTTHIPVKSYIPEFVQIAGNDELQPVYYIDLECLKPRQQQRLIRYFAIKFNVSLEQVKQYIEEQDVPVLAEDCSLTIHNPHRWLA